MVYLIQAQFNLEFLLNELLTLQATDPFGFVAAQQVASALGNRTGQLWCHEWSPALAFVRYLHIYNFRRPPQFLAIY